MGFPILREVQLARRFPLLPPFHQGTFVSSLVRSSSTLSSPWSLNVSSSRLSHLAYSLMSVGSPKPFKMH